MIELQPQKPGVRYEKRQAANFMYDNLANGKCWCGKPKSEFEQFQRKYCTSEHAQIWFYRINCYWGAFRSMICLRDSGLCKKCGRKVAHLGKSHPTFSNLTTIIDWEVDHILAISLGGMCYDPKNVQLLCSKCHNKKTAIDLRKLSLKKKNQEVLVPL